MIPGCLTQRRKGAKGAKLIRRHYSCDARSARSLQRHPNNMTWFYRLKIDSLLYPLLGIGICLVLWYAIAGKSTVTQSKDEWGDTVTMTRRHGLSADLPTPVETWKASRNYVLQPLAKRGELDQGILRFTWLSLVLVAQGYALALLVGVPSASVWGFRRRLQRCSIRSFRCFGQSPRSHGCRSAWCSFSARKLSCREALPTPPRSWPRSYRRDLLDVAHRIEQRPWGCARFRRIISTWRRC